MRSNYQSYFYPCRGGLFESEQIRAAKMREICIELTLLALSVRGYVVSSAGGRGGRVPLQVGQLRQHFLVLDPQPNASLRVVEASIGLLSTIALWMHCIHPSRQVN
jgi:hypothetical protein